MQEASQDDPFVPPTQGPARARPDALSWDRLRSLMKGELALPPLFWAVIGGAICRPLAKPAGDAMWPAAFAQPGDAVDGMDTLGFILAPLVVAGAAAIACRPASSTSQGARTGAGVGAAAAILGATTYWIPPLAAIAQLPYVNLGGTEPDPIAVNAAMAAVAMGTPALPVMGILVLGLFGALAGSLAGALVSGGGTRDIRLDDRTVLFAALVVCPMAAIMSLPGIGTSVLAALITQAMWASTPEELLETPHLVSLLAVPVKLAPFALAVPAATLWASLAAGRRVRTLFDPAPMWERVVWVVAVVATMAYTWNSALLMTAPLYDEFRSFFEIFVPVPIPVLMGAAWVVALAAFFVGMRFPAERTTRKSTFTALLEALLVVGVANLCVAGPFLVSQGAVAMGSVGSVGAVQLGEPVDLTGFIAMRELYDGVQLGMWLRLALGPFSLGGLPVFTVIAVATGWRASREREAEDMRRAATQARLERLSEGAIHGEEAAGQPSLEPPRTAPHGSDKPSSPTHRSM